MDILAEARDVLQQEAKGIENLIPTLDQNFVNAVHMIMESKGRTIVTGMGKSGHIARKVSATLSSTGTPSIFLHPAEGIHGDLGMVTGDDVVLAFSNSGETVEILNILPSLKRIGAKIIAVVGNHNSTLAKNSDVILDASVEKEACPLGLAPTTSTTVALALGDALAIVLLSCHHFTKNQFAIYHPGGALGRKLLMTVENVMHKGNDNPVISEDSIVQDALFMMTEKGLGAVSVVDEEGRLVGLVTDGDVRRGLETGSNFLQWPVDAMMTKNPRQITSDKLAAEALHIMEKNQPRPITVLPVVDGDGKAVGMVHLTDLLRQGVV
ncbi:KpsF/GutQ family sugar-phosphate isomerase [Megasphaera sp. ASD88]|jgi:arabinose-5-phosphate isomerase|uniref:KpsF/GutQ family sugar-phosphate isomerase n=1 Tax=Megasphaera stantonii TaxID=2144175 RepID=A0A346B0Q4_9FIRM|nr:MULTISPECIES: KpsF/GutQ family sugar-phosphate isomerase [Megasphaera]MDN0046683.1 KpsF/GutQ family sugar-phosphate isomerase [Megasphaera hexanoica]SCI76641.1 Arabinose 5-phosphate isomerase KdsD [uncultured Ruminococcus sp.]AXL21697.1 KpsF/GutQ family sugar-phosphate isomerase [Megasphaera stantonii]MBM6731552.1 KpsF/GutQ family sugar-phosphate isomerase [Megasphaera stantonii]MCU6714308.1 KpsF/GutQ family sugar-phosphate isomerase [Megasphaera butyrica]